MLVPANAARSAGRDEHMVGHDDDGAGGDARRATKVRPIAGTQDMRVSADVERGPRRDRSAAPFATKLSEVRLSNETRRDRRQVPPRPRRPAVSAEEVAEPVRPCRR